jgi:agmatinase
MWNDNHETLFGCGTSYEDAKIVVFGAPFDSTTSYRPGARFGGKAIRAESYGLESYSPYHNKDLTDVEFFDGGELELQIGDTVNALAAIEKSAAQILNDGKLPVMLGGEHLVTLGAVRAALNAYPDLHIIHFDAHADLRDDYLGVKLSHACVIRRCWELLGDGRIYQLGIRSGTREEFEWAAQGHVSLYRDCFEGLQDALTKLDGKPVYLTVDLDVLDPSCFPGTGTPEPGGIDFSGLHYLLKKVCDSMNIVACDFVELCPPYDPSGISTITAGKLLRELLIAIRKI